MKDQWHEQIQCCADGQSSEEEIGALHRALGADAELRNLYLDYMNLEAALSAMADAEVTATNGAGGTTADPRRIDRPPARYWRWVAGAAAAAALVMLVMPLKRHEVLRAQPDLAAATASAHAAITRLSAGAPPVLPAWMSPTASLLDQPALPK